MIAYDVNDAPRQQLFPPERVRGAAGPGTIVLKSRTRPRDVKKRTVDMATNAIGSNILAGATKLEIFLSDQLSNFTNIQVFFLNILLLESIYLLDCQKEPNTFFPRGGGSTRARLSKRQPP